VLPATRAVARLAGLAAAGLAYAAVEAQWFALRQVEVPVLPANAPPFKVLHLTDLHITPGQRRKAAWVAALVRLEPDLVVTTGDNLGGPAALPRLTAALGPLLDLPGAFVFGSNDYFSSKPKNPFGYFWRRPEPDHWRRPDLPVAALRQLLVDRGWSDLNNARATVPLAAGLVEVVGLADPHLGLDRLPAAVPPSAVADGGSALIKLGLVHAPYRAAVRSMVEDGAQLVLAGHTHGGQVAVPWHGALVSNCDLPPGFARGLHRLATPTRSGFPASPVTEPVVHPMPAPHFLHVSSGLGTSPYAPVRFACRPEASLLTLVPAE